MYKNGCSFPLASCILASDLAEQSHVVNLASRGGKQILLIDENLQCHIERIRMRGEKEYIPFLQATIVCLWLQLLGANLR